MRAGRAEIDITCAADAMLAGGAYGAASAVHSALTASVLVIEQGDQRLVLIACDLLGFDNAFAWRLRQQVAHTVGTEPAAVMLAASHTHGGPVTMNLSGWGQVDTDYCEQLAQDLARASRAAIADLRDVRLAYGSSQWDEVGVIRSRFGGGLDARLWQLRVEDLSGQVLACCVQVASHPVLMHSTGMVSADYPGALRQALQAQHGPDCAVVFWLGPCGNVNPPTFSFQRDGNESPEQRQEAAQKCQVFAEQLAAHFLAQSLQVVPSDQLSCFERALDLPAQAFPDADQCRTMIARLAETKTANRWEQAAQDIEQNWYQACLQGELLPRPALPVQELQIGGLTILAVPAELVAALGQDIHADPHACLVTIANGYHGYICIDEAIAAATYEAAFVPKMLDTAPYAEGVCQSLLNQIQSLQEIP